MTAPSDRRQIRGWHVLVALCGFFAVVFTVDGLFAWRAMATFPGEVSVTPYEDGLLYNRKIAQLESQARLGWRAAAAALPGEIELIVRDRQGRPVEDLAASGKLERPATESGRIHLTFAETAPGRYVAPTGAIGGFWDLTVEARDSAGRPFIAERRLSWP